MWWKYLCFHFIKKILKDFNLSMNKQLLLLWWKNIYCQIRSSIRNGLRALISCWYLDTWAMLQKVDATITLLLLSSPFFIAAGLFLVRVNPIYFMVNHFKMLKNDFFRFCHLLFCRAKNMTGLPDLS